MAIGEGVEDSGLLVAPFLLERIVSAGEDRRGDAG
jgi:hypothetical protein